MGSWNEFVVTGNKGDKGSDGDLGILTLSFDESTINIQGNDQATGYVIYNNTKFYMSGDFTATTGGDGVIIADIRTTPATLHFKKLSVDDSVLSFVDFNTGLNPIYKEGDYGVDSIWEYILIGEFSCLNDGTLINAAIKPAVSVTIFLSNTFTAILKNNAFTKEKMKEWATAMGCDEYYSTLAVSTLFAGEIFANEITLTDNGVIKSEDTNESVRIQADGLAKFKNLILEFGGNTMFKVDSTTGNVNFGYDTEGNPLFYYEQSSSSIKSKDENLIISSDGTIQATDGTFEGTVNATNGFFKGYFDTTALVLQQGTKNENVIGTYNGTGTGVYAFIDDFIAEGYDYGVLYPCSFSYDSLVKSIVVSSSSFIRFQDSTKTTIYLIARGKYNNVPWVKFYTGQSTDSANEISMPSTFDISIFSGGDVLKLSSDVPTSLTGLDDYQLYLDGDTLKAKLPS